MTVVFTKEADEIFRDYVTDGVPASGIHMPPKSDLRVWGSELEDFLKSIGVIGELGTGIVVKSAAATYLARSIAAGTGMAVTNGDGVAGNPSIAIDKATDANVFAAVSNKVLTADLLESAAAEVVITDGGSPAVNWEAGENFVWTLGANRTFPNPTNGHPRTYRTVRLLGNSTTDRTLTFGTEFSAFNLPTLTDIDSAQQYLLTIVCITTSWFAVLNAIRIDSP